MGIDTKLIGVVYAITGIIFAWFTYPFFQALITAMDGAGYDGWTFISAILWTSYAVTIFSWIILIPTLTILRDTHTNPFLIIKHILYFIFGVAFIYISYPVLTVLIGLLDPLIVSNDWDAMTYVLWVAYTGIILAIMVGKPLYDTFNNEA